MISLLLRPPYISRLDVASLAFAGTPHREVFAFVLARSPSYTTMLTIILHIFHPPSPRFHFADMDKTGPVRRRHHVIIAHGATAPWEFGISD